MLIREVDLGAAGGPARADLRVRDGLVVAVARTLERTRDEPVFAGRGGALLPGLHDHHVHLLSLSAALDSVRCGPPEVVDARALARVLARRPGEQGPGDDWVRGYGYHESVAGDLDADALEALAPGRPLRVQHRSGAMWIVSRTGLVRLGLDGPLPDAVPEGVERDLSGRATGRLYRVDAWLRERLGSRAAPSLAAVGARLASFGVTGATDATPGNDAAELALFRAARSRGELPQRLRLMGRASLPAGAGPGIERGAVKQVLDEARGLDPDDLARQIREARADDRATAVHCVTRAELVVALAAFEAAGCRPGDRIEHASVAPPELAEALARLGLTVVTQPNFVRERGDAYLQDVEPTDRPWLYRCRGLLEAGVALGAGTDAPFGDPDPWQAMRAAIDRRTEQGAALGCQEALDPERALALFTTPADAPGGPPRRVVPGEPADLCLLDRPWKQARERLDASGVAATWIEGRIAFRRGTPDGGDA